MKTMTMRVYLAILLCAMFGVSAFGQGTGLGIRIGEPTGFSFKKYLPNNQAFEVSVGATGYLYNRSYAAGKWESGGLSLMANYMYQQPIPAVKGLDWYLGGGGSAKLRSFRYSSAEGEGISTNTRVSFALNGVAGLEYSFQKAPVSVFLDVIPYIELAPYPFRPAVDGGMGVRYNF